MAGCFDFVDGLAGVFRKIKIFVNLYARYFMERDQLIFELRILGFGVFKVDLLEKRIEFVLERSMEILHLQNQGSR